MLNIDQLAYSSKLIKTDAMEKLFLAVATIFVSLWLNSIISSIIVLYVMTWMTVRKGGTPLAFFLKLMMVPMPFLLIGVLTVSVSWSASGGQFLLSLPFCNTYFGVTKNGLVTASYLFFRVLSAVSCLYFLSLSTPMVELLFALRKLKCPSLFLELMSLIYRFIFVFMETAQKIYIAQNSRLGYASFATSFKSLGTLVSTLFFRTYKRSDELYSALESRGYEDELRVLEEPRDRHYANYLQAAGFNVFLLLAALLFRL